MSEISSLVFVMPILLGIFNTTCFFGKFSEVNDLHPAVQVVDV